MRLIPAKTTAMSLVTPQMDQFAKEAILSMSPLR